MDSDIGLPTPVERATTRGVFVSRRARRRTLAALVALLVAGAAASHLARAYLPWLADPVAVRAGIEAYGPLAPIAFVAVQAAQVVVAPVPGQVLGFASGYLFGTLHGTLYSLLGVTIGSWVVFWLSRRFGRRHVERAVAPELLERFDDLIDERGRAALLLVFLVPGLPDDAVCFAAGLTDIRIRELVAISVVGRFPGYLLVNAAGARLAAGRPTETVAIVVALVVVSLLGIAWREPVLRRIGRQPPEGAGGDGA